MGDNCWIHFFIATRDKQAFDDELGPFEVVDTLDDDDKETSLEAGEVNQGLQGERKEAASKGLAFYGRHGEGGGYGPMAFAAFGGQMVEVMTNHDGFPVARVGEDGAVCPSDVARCVAYYDMEAKVLAHIAKEGDNVNIVEQKKY